MNDHKDMNTAFVKSLVKEMEDKPKAEKEEKTTAFKAGLVFGTIVVAAGTLCLEAALFALVANVLGWKLTFLQGLSIAALFEFISLRFIRRDS